MEYNTKADVSATPDDDGGFLKLPNHEIQAIDKLPPPAYKLYIVLRSMSNVNKKPAYPSQKYLANRIGCTIKNIKRIEQQLVDIGLIEKHIKGNKRYIHFKKLKGEVFAPKGGSFCPARGKESSSKGEVFVQQETTKNEPLTLVQPIEPASGKTPEQESYPESLTKKEEEEEDYGKNRAALANILGSFGDKLERTNKRLTKKARYERY